MSFHSVRRVDLGVLLTFLTLCALIYAGIGKPIAWDQAVRDVDDLKPKVEETQKQLVELRAINSTQMSLIIRELDNIHRELKRDGR